MICPIGKNDYGLEDVCPRSACLPPITWTHTHSLLKCFEAYLECSSHHAYWPTSAIHFRDHGWRYTDAALVLGTMSHVNSDSSIRLHHGEYHNHHIPVPFDSHFIKEFDIVIRIFAGLAFPDDENLGFDSTVSCILSRQPNTIQIWIWSWAESLISPPTRWPIMLRISYLTQGRARFRGSSRVQR